MHYMLSNMQRPVTQPAKYSNPSRWDEVLAGTKQSVATLQGRISLLLSVPTAIFFLNMLWILDYTHDCVYLVSEPWKTGMFCSFNCYLLLILGSFLHLGTVIIHLPRTQRKQVSNRLIVGIAAFIVPECSATTYLMYLGPRFSLSSCLALCACVNIVVLAGMLHVPATTEPLGLRVATFVDFKTWKVCTCRQHKKMLNITPGVNFKDMVLPTDQTELEVITPEGSPHSMILRVQCSSTRSLLTVLVCMHWLGDSLWSPTLKRRSRLLTIP